MQKQRCHEFAAEKGWDIIAEFSEKGVSGFKVSAKDRDAVQEIQRDAAMGKFDILLADQVAECTEIDLRALQQLIQRHDLLLRAE